MKKEESALEAMYNEASDQVKNKINSEIEDLAKKGAKASISDMLAILQNNLEPYMVQELDSCKIIGYMVLNDDGKSMPSLEIDYIDQYKNKMDKLFKTKVLNKVNGFPAAFDQICDFLDKADKVGTISGDIVGIWNSGIESDNGNDEATINMLSKVFDLVSDVSGIVVPKGVNIIGMQMDVAKGILAGLSNLIINHIKEIDKNMVYLDLYTSGLPGDDGLASALQSILNDNPNDDNITFEQLDEILERFGDKLPAWLNEYRDYLLAEKIINDFVESYTELIEKAEEEGRKYLENYNKFIDLAANDEGLKEIVTPIYMNGLINKDDIDKISVRLSDVNNKNNKVTVNQNSINNAANTAPVRADPIILDLNGDGIYSKNIADGTNFDFAGRRITA